MIILASQSEIRRTLLFNAGVSFTTMKSPFNEEAMQTEFAHIEPKPLAQKLALAKALAISVQTPEAFIIGVDQTLECEGRILHKSATLDEAKTNLQHLRGKTHCLHTAYSILRGQETVASHCDTATLTMRNFDNAFLDTYLNLNQHSILQSVGCYQLETQGIQLMQHIDGDYFSILGLPLLPLITHLRELGAMPS